MLLRFAKCFMFWQGCILLDHCHLGVAQYLGERAPLGLTERALLMTPVPNQAPIITRQPHALPLYPQIAERKQASLSPIADQLYWNPMSAGWSPSGFVPGHAGGALPAEWLLMRFFSAAYVAGWFDGDGCSSMFWGDVRLDMTQCS